MITVKRLRELRSKEQAGQRRESRHAARILEEAKEDGRQELTKHEEGNWRMHFNTANYHQARVQLLLELIEEAERDNPQTG